MTLKYCAFDKTRNCDSYCSAYTEESYTATFNKDLTSYEKIRYISIKCLRGDFSLGSRQEAI